MTNKEFMKDYEDLLTQIGDTNWWVYREGECKLLHFHADRDPEAVQFAYVERTEKGWICDHCKYIPPTMDWEAEAPPQEVEDVADLICTRKP